MIAKESEENQVRWAMGLPATIIFLYAATSCAPCTWALPSRSVPATVRPATAIVATVATDLDSDGKIERVVLDARLDPVLAVWRGKKRLWRGVPQRWKPWKLTTADVDGDGKREIVLGVFKPTRFFPRPHNCLFVYGWDGKRAFPKWLGSSLSRPFTDFLLADLDGDREDELIALETTRAGKHCVVVYSWVGFGFGFDWQSVAWQSARLIGVREGKIIVKVQGKRISATERAK